MLQQEEAFQNCEKRFVLNRITNATLEHDISMALTKAHIPHTRIEFSRELYQQIPLDTSCFPHPLYFLDGGYYNLSPDQRLAARASLYRKKNSYVFNNNGARNTALKEGRQLGDWILPWDGNCFLDVPGWTALYRSLQSTSTKYVTVPMVRLTNFPNGQSQPFDSPNATEEPQVAFHAMSEQVFDESFTYGDLPKAELLQRLGTPGPWLAWGGSGGILGLQCPKQSHVVAQRSKQRYDVTAGWVARLPSGNNVQEVGHGASKARWRGRTEGLVKYLMDLDMSLQHHRFADPVFYDITVLQREAAALESSTQGELEQLADKLFAEARAALSRGTSFFRNRTWVGQIRETTGLGRCLQSSGSENARTESIKRGFDKEESSHAARLLSSGSLGFNASIVQQVFADTLISAVAWFFSGNRSYAYHGATLLHACFLDVDTRISPDLKSSRDPASVPNLEIIDLKDLYFVLDAVRLLELSGAFTTANVLRFKTWLRVYLDFLRESNPGRREMLFSNNRGIYYDLQTASIAAYLEDRTSLIEAFARAQSKIPFHFAPDGEQPKELANPASWHCCGFNLMGWIHMAMISHKFGAPILRARSAEGASINSAIEYHLRHASRRPFSDGGGVRIDHYKVFLWKTQVPDMFESSLIELGGKYKVQPMFPLDHGVRPFWNLGLRLGIFQL